MVHMSRPIWLTAQFKDQQLQSQMIYLNHKLDDNNRACLLGGNDSKIDLNYFDAIFKIHLNSGRYNTEESENAYQNNSTFFSTFGHRGLDCLDLCIRVRDQLLWESRKLWLTTRKAMMDNDNLQGTNYTNSLPRIS